MSRTLGLEGKVLILTWESEFSGLAALREGPLLFFFFFFESDYKGSFPPEDNCKNLLVPETFKRS